MKKREVRRARAVIVCSPEFLHRFTMSVRLPGEKRLEPVFVEEKKAA